MAGGTGAGLGSSFAEALRDEYARRIRNHCVWPYGTGEVIVQSYNALLTLSLLDVSDGVCVVQNEHLHAACAAPGRRAPDVRGHERGRRETARGRVAPRDEPRRLRRDVGFLPVRAASDDAAA